MQHLKFKLIGICILHGLLGSNAMLAPGQELKETTSGKWYTNLDEAAAESKRTGKPILMEINGRPWCPPCNAQGEKIINHPEFQAWARENVVLLDVKVGKGYDKNAGNPIWAEQLKQHHLSGIPAAVLIDQHGETMGVVFPKDDVQQWLGAAKNIITAHALLDNDRSGANSLQVIPFRLTKSNNLSVPVTINDSIALNLMFHTAVDSVSLTQATTERFPEINLDQVADAKSWGGESKTRLGKGHTLKIAGLMPQKVTLFEALYSGHDTDGKFGPDSLSSRLWAIDFDRSEIRLLSNLPGDISEWKKHDIETEQGMMFIKATVHNGDEGATHKFMIHSGYSGFALLDDEFAAANPFLKKLEIIDKSELTDSAGHKLETSKVRLPKFSLGETAFENVPASFFSGAIGRQKFSVLGGDFLKRFNLVFDLENKALYLKKSQYFSSEHF